MFQTDLCILLILEFFVKHGSFHAVFLSLEWRLRERLCWKAHWAQSSSAHCGIESFSLYKHTVYTLHNKVVTVENVDEYAG